jgi:hypothetical protein
MSVKSIDQNLVASVGSGSLVPEVSPLDSTASSVKNSVSGILNQSNSAQMDIQPIPSLSPSDQIVPSLAVDLSAISLAGNKNEFLDERTRVEIKHVLTEDWELTRNKFNEHERVRFYLHAKHAIVFEHSKFPGLIFKDMRSENQLKESKTNIDHARDVLKTWGEKLGFCHVPCAEVIELDDDRKLLVMQKAQGITNPSLCNEMSEVEFEKFPSSPDAKAKWLAFFLQAAEFICLIGYWDTSRPWANIIFDLIQGFTFIDFENNKSTTEKKKMGIEGLLKMAHPDFFDPIAEVAQRYGVEIKDISEMKQKRAEELACHSEVRKWHEAQQVQSKSCVDASQWGDDSFEKKIIEKWNEKCLSQSDYQSEKRLIEQRTLHWHPSFPFEEQVNHPERVQEVFRNFEKALDNLKDKGIIGGWRLDQCGYAIYF